MSDTPNDPTTIDNGKENRDPRETQASPSESAKSPKSSEGIPSRESLPSRQSRAPRDEANRDGDGESSESGGAPADITAAEKQRGEGRREERPGGGGSRHRNKNRNKGGNQNQRREEPLGPPEESEGLLEISGKGFGFLRQREKDFAQTPQDVFVTPEVVRINGLRDGLWIKCVSRKGHRGPQLTEILQINGRKPEAYRNLPYFEELTAINPNKRIVLETDADRKTTRVIDMMTPIGRGQRGLIVAPPRTGKTTLLQHIGEAITRNQPEMKLIMMLIDERPEEVTEFTRELPNAEIYASSNDSDVKAHTRIAQLAIERAKRLVEAGEHVFILLDSITRLGRAFNNATKGNGRTMSGGIDAKALEIPRRLFAAARNTREGGSLTIIASALIQTGSKMDELIFQEFKGTGNMELVLDRKISEQYVYPAVDIHKSGTRREELLLPPHQLEKTYIIRRGLAGHKPVEAIERLLSFIERFPNNAQLLLEIKASAAA